jgi:hypothetical protein
MRNMSFFKTVDQIKRHQKFVTRRIGWKFLKPGDIVQACVKCQGLKKGEKIKKIAVIKIINTWFEPLDILIADSDYGFDEMVKEGFPGMVVPAFIKMFCEMNCCKPSTNINRIEFIYI